MSWIKTENQLPTKDGLYFITHKPEHLEEGKLPMSEVAAYSTATGAWMATFMITTLSGPMVITFRNVTHWMEIPKIDEE